MRRPPYHRPVAIKRPLVRTPAVTHAIHTVYDAFEDRGFVVISGVAGAGKTSTAELLLEDVNNEWFSPDNPDSVRAHKMEAGTFERNASKPDKRAVVGIYNDVVGRLDRGIANNSDTSEISALLIQALRERHIGMLLIDEAGGYNLGALRGLLTLGNVARLHKHPLQIVLIGMDDLPKTIKRLGQLRRRVTGWVFFKEYTEDDTLNFLKKVEPLFADHGWDDPEHAKQVHFIHRVTRGLPGYIVPFLNRVVRQMERTGAPLSFQLLIGVHAIHQEAEDLATKHSGFGSADSSGISKRSTNDAGYRGKEYGRRRKKEERGEADGGDE